jgi:hypothetical protein
MMIRDRIAKELMSAHEPVVVQPEVEEPPMVEVEEVDDEVEEVLSSL